MKIVFSIILILCNLMLIGQSKTELFKIKSIDSSTFINFYLIKIENKQKDTFLLFQDKNAFKKLESEFKEEIIKEKLQVGSIYCILSLIEFNFKEKDSLDINFRGDYAISGVNGMFLTAKQKAYTSNDIIGLYFIKKIDSKCLKRKKWSLCK